MEYEVFNKADSFEGLLVEFGVFGTQFDLCIAQV